MSHGDLHYVLIPFLDRDSTWENEPLFRQLVALLPNSQVKTLTIQESNGVGVVGHYGEILPMPEMTFECDATLWDKTNAALSGRGKVSTSFKSSDQMLMLLRRLDLPSLKKDWMNDRKRRWTKTLLPP